jgi:hypothetical protein
MCLLEIIIRGKHMSKMTFLILSIASLVLVGVGEGLQSSQSSTSLILAGIGGLVALVTWIMGLVKMVQLKRWGWFVAVFFLAPLSTLLYGIYGPAHPRG